MSAVDDDDSTVERWTTLRAALEASVPSSTFTDGELQIPVTFEDGSSHVIHIRLLGTLGLDLLELRCDVCPRDALVPADALETNADLALPGLALSEGGYILRHTTPATALDAPTLLSLVRTLAASADLLAHASARA